MRRVLIATMSFVFGLVSLTLIALVALSHGWQREWLRVQVERQLATSLALPVALESIDGPLHREFTLRGVLVGDPTAPWIEAAAMQIRVGSLRLLGRPSLRLGSVRIDAPRVNLKAVDAREPPVADAQASWPLRIEMGSLVVRDGRIERSGDDTRFRFDFGADVTELAVDEATTTDAITIDFELSDPNQPGDVWGRGVTRGRFAGEHWELDELHIAGPELELDAHGRGDTASLDALELSLRVASIERLMARVSPETPGLTGEIELSGSLHGPFRWPRGAVSLRAKNLSSEGVALGNVDLEALSPRDGELVIEALQLSGGPVDLESVATSTITASEERTSIGALRLRRPNASGALELEASLPGLTAGSFASALGHPETRLSVKTIAWPLAALQPLWHLAGIEATGTLDAHAVVRSDAGQPVVKASGRVEQGGLVAGNLAATGADLLFDVQGDPYVPEFDVRGTVASVEFDAQRLGAVDVALRSSSARELFVERFSLTGGAVPLHVVPGSRVALRGERLEFRGFQIESEGQRIVAEGVIDGPAAKGLTLRVDAFDIGRALDTLATLGLVEATPVRGRIDGEIVWAGTLAAPSLSASLTASEVWLGEFGVDRVDARVETEGQQILAESDWSRGGASRLHTRAFLPRDLVFAQPGSLLQHPRTRIEAQLQEFDLAALAAFLPSEVSKIGGVVDARVEARGGPERPELSGTLALEGGTLALAALRQRPLEPMSARLRFDNDRIFLQQLTIGSAEAGVSAQGEAQIESDQVASVDLGVAFEKFPIDARGLVRGTLSGPIRISGKPRALALTGELELADLKIEIPEEDDATVKEIRVISGDGTTPGLTIQEDETETSIIDPMRVDLELRIARNSWARGRGAEVELQGSLRAKKTRKTAIRLDGTIETVRGTYEIYGRRFRIERGEAVLDGAEDPDPVLNARALHRVRGVRIYAILEGRLSDPRLRFESQPELTETDIASYLLLGRPVSGDEGPPPALDAVAAQVATGAAVREFERLLGGTLPVDLLDVRMEKNGDTSELRAGVGKYVGDRLFLHYERGFGDEPEDELQAEYELDDNWSIESSVSSEGQTSADLIFEIEY